MHNKKLVMSMVFHIDAKSDKSKKNMRNKIRNRLAEVLQYHEDTINLIYDNHTNSYAFVEENSIEKFEDKIIFLIATLQKFGYAYVITGNLDNKEFDIVTSQSNMVGVRFIQGYLSYQDIEWV